MPERVVGSSPTKSTISFTSFLECDILFKSEVSSLEEHRASNDSESSNMTSGDQHVVKRKTSLAGTSWRLGVRILHLRPIFAAQSIGLPECPYMRRWVVDFGAFAIRIHRWESSDDDRAFHDHPWWFITLVLRGSYDDVSLSGLDTLRVGSIRFRSASHRHTVKIKTPGTWTLLITGRAKRRWGFWVGGKLLKRDRYFAVHGHHPCSNGEPVRLRPDGTRI